MLLIPLLLPVVACGGTSRTSDVPRGHTSVVDAPAPADAPITDGGQAVPTQSGAVNCASALPGMGEARAIEIITVDFPATGAAIATITSPASAPLQVVQYTACIQVVTSGSGDISVPTVSDTSSPAAEVVAALHVSERGWLSSSSFPFDGRTPQTCSKAQLCFKSGPQRYLELEQVAAHEQGIFSFVLRVATAQSVTECDPALFPVEYYADSTVVFVPAEFPLPPLTRVSRGQGDSAGTMTYFCSVESTDLIEYFMDKQLPAWGWSSLTVAGQRVWKFDSGVGPVYMRIYPVTDPHKWAILTYNNGANFG